MTSFFKSSFDGIYGKDSDDGDDQCLYLQVPKSKSCSVGRNKSILYLNMNVDFVNEEGEEEEEEEDYSEEYLDNDDSNFDSESDGQKGDNINANSGTSGKDGIILDDHGKRIKTRKRSKNNVQYHLIPSLGFKLSDAAQGSNLELQWQYKNMPHIKEGKKAWDDFLKGIGKKSITSGLSANSMRALIRKYPVPTQFRPKVWLVCSGAQKKIEENEGYYKTLLEVHEKQTSVADTQIEMDLSRTFPNHPFFNSEDSIGRQQMRRILVAYSWRNPLIAYCQSLNYIVGILLLHFSEEEAFWMLVIILEDLLPANFYSPQLKGLRVDGKVFEDILKERLPKTYNHFTQNGVDAVSFICGWFMRIYVDVFPLETTLRVWDLFFNEGSKILFRIALAYLKLNETKILQLKHIGEVLHFLNANTQQEYNYQQLVKTCFSFYYLKREQIEKARRKYIPIIDQETQELEQKRKAMKEKLKQRERAIASPITTTTTNSNTPANHALSPTSKDPPTSNSQIKNEIQQAINDQQY